MGGAGLCARHGAALTVEQQWEGPGVLVHPGSRWICQPGGKSLLWGHRGGIVTLCSGLRQPHLEP